MGALRARRSSRGARMSHGRRDVTDRTVGAQGGGLAAAATEAAVVEAVSSVCDPEYPEITIAELGILERVSASDDGSMVRIELVPTMLGCPALDLIARDVRTAAQAACADLGEGTKVDTRAMIQAGVSAGAGVSADAEMPVDAGAPVEAGLALGVSTAVEVVFVDEPVWTPERIAPSAVEFMAREYSVAVRSGEAGVECPICGNAALEHRSDFGPTPCRSVEWCPNCRNPIEVVGRVDIRLTAPTSLASGPVRESQADRCAEGAAGLAADRSGTPSSPNQADRCAAGAAGFVVSSQVRAGAAT